MKFNKTIFAIALGLLLSACGTVTATPQGQYQSVTYEYPKINHNVPSVMIGNKAEEACPVGYEVVKQTHTSVNQETAKDIWLIKCN